MKKDQSLLLFGVIGSFLFTFLIWLIAKNGFDINYSPDTGYLHYYWKLPKPDFMARITSWGGYIAHQISTWYILYLAIKNKKKFGHDLTKYNWWMLGTQTFFITYHIVQTRLWYDALAQDTSIILSQGSVVIMLVLIMLLLNGIRGIFFGKKANIPDRVSNYVRKYHGYYILWATVFTFWYHPTEATIGHLVGFFYMFLLFVQSITIYTKSHINRWWMFLLEFFVLLHGTTVAINAGNGMWPMFAFGFGFMTIAVQIYSLPISKITRTILQIIYFILLGFVYAGGFNSQRSITDIVEIINIPIVDYIVLLLLVLVISVLTIRSKNKRH